MNSYDRNNDQIEVKDIVDSLLTSLDTVLAEIGNVSRKRIARKGDEVTSAPIIAQIIGALESVLISAVLKDTETA